MKSGAIRLSLPFDCYFSCILPTFKLLSPNLNTVYCKFLPLTLITRFMLVRGFMVVCIYFISSSTAIFTCVLHQSSLLFYIFRGNDSSITGVSVSSRLARIFTERILSYQRILQRPKPNYLFRFRTRQIALILIPPFNDEMAIAAIQSP